MIASSLKEEDGLVALLLSKGAEVSIQNHSGQVCQDLRLLYRATVLHVSAF